MSDFTNPMQFPDRFSNDHPHQLRMFMTPREIKDQYQTLPADRRQKYHYETDNDYNYRQRVHNPGEFESNDAVWDRKAKEAVGRGRVTRRGKTGLAESVAAEGVKSVVHLGVTDSTRFPENGPLKGQSIYQASASDGRPAVVGGHHRIATAAQSRPDDLIPVMHHQDIWSARGRKEQVGYADPGVYKLVYKPSPWEKAYRSKYS